MLELAHVAAAAEAKGDWVLEVVIFSVIIAAGLALIFVAVLRQQRRAQEAQSIGLTIKNLFSLNTNPIGLFALIGLALVGGALYAHFKDYRGQLLETRSRYDELEKRVALERAEWKEQLDQYKYVSLDFLLRFPDDALPSDLEVVTVRAAVRPSEPSGTRKDMEVQVQPAPGGLIAKARELHTGDTVRLRATDGKRTWVSDHFVVPSITLDMHTSDLRPEEVTRRGGP